MSPNSQRHPRSHSYRADYPSENASPHYNAFIDDKQRNNFRLIVRGKTGERDAIIRSVAAKRLDEYLAVRRAADPGGLLFVMRDGSPIITLIDQLTSALKEAGIERNSFGEKYSVYSLRHFYAVNALRNGIGEFEVARNMGTSGADDPRVLRQAGHISGICYTVRGLDIGSGCLVQKSTDHQEPDRN